VFISTAARAIDGNLPVLIHSSVPSVH